MKKEEDLISILLEETYGQISNSLDSKGESSLSDYFHERQNQAVASFDDNSISPTLFRDFVRLSFSDQVIDIPFDLGIIEKTVFQSSEELKLAPIEDFIFMNMLSEKYEKKVSWLGYYGVDNQLYFLTRSEAIKMSSDQEIEMKKVA